MPCRRTTRRRGFRRGARHPASAAGGGSQLGPRHCPRGPNAPKIDGISDNHQSTGTNRNPPLCRVFPARVSSQACLKIVVSPVRVRVSPSREAPARRVLPESGFLASVFAAACHKRVRSPKRSPNATARGPCSNAPTMRHPPARGRVLNRGAASKPSSHRTPNSQGRDSGSAKARGSWFRSPPETPGSSSVESGSPSSRRRG